jgi:hypothetical protein
VDQATREPGGEDEDDAVGEGGSHASTSCGAAVMLSAVALRFWS